MTRFLLFLLVVCGALAMGGCASEPPSPTAVPHVSTMPWNTPTKGEGQGVMGSMINTM